MGANYETFKQDTLAVDEARGSTGRHHHIPVRGEVRAFSNVSWATVQQLMIGPDSWPQE